MEAGYLCAVTPDDVTIEPCPLSDPDAAELIGELDELLDSLYPPEDNHFTLLPDEVDGTNGLFLVARDSGGRALGCGAVRLLGDGRAEIKRMYVRPSARGRGIGKAILSRLEAEAELRGARALVLEMGADQPEARRLYESFGFRPIPCWGEYLATPASVCLGKDL
nr:GNAT family N-acetyltransferase [Acidimicrobiia bacterium]